MTVNELIAKLKQLKQPNAKVFVCANSDGAVNQITGVQDSVSVNGCTMDNAVLLNDSTDTWHKIDNEWVLNPHWEDIP